MELSHPRYRVAAAACHDFPAHPGDCIRLGCSVYAQFSAARVNYSRCACFSLFWVAYEYLNEISSPHSTFGNLGYTRRTLCRSFRSLLSRAFGALVSSHFYSPPLLPPCLIARRKPRRRRALAVVVTIVVGAVLLYGIWRLHANSPRQSVAVTLMAKDVPMSVYLGPEEQALELLQEYADEVRRATPAGTSVVILPEKIARLSEASLTKVDALFFFDGVCNPFSNCPWRSSANINSQLQFRSFLLRGRKTRSKLRQASSPAWSRAGATGRQTSRARPTFRGLGTADLQGHGFSSTEPGLRGCRRRPALVPAWDFNLDRWLHSRMAVLRAVENGFGLARSARNGLLTLSDSRGRILAEAATAPGRFVSVSGQVSLSREENVLHAER